MATAAQLTANFENAQHSTGPQSAEGKRRAALNSTRHGFTGQVVLLTAEEAEPYRKFNDSFQSELQPVGAEEKQLVRSFIDAKWRLNQIAATESAIFALGHREYADAHPDESPDMLFAAARVHVITKHAKELERLRRYERQLHRQSRLDREELAELQKLRFVREEEELYEALKLHVQFTSERKSWDPAAFGFVWSIPQIEEFARKNLRYRGMLEELEPEARYEAGA